MQPQLPGGARDGGSRAGERPARVPAQAGHAGGQAARAGERARATRRPVPCTLRSVASSRNPRAISPDLARSRPLSLDLAALARSIGFTDARQVRTAEDLSPALSGALESAGPSFFALLTDPDLDVVVPPNHLDPVTVKRRFMDCIGAKPYRSTLFGGGLSE